MCNFKDLSTFARRHPSPGVGVASAPGYDDSGELWTALSARRRGTGFDVIAGPEEMRPLMGLISGDYRRDYRHLARAVEDKLAPLAFGCYADVDTLERLLVDTRPGAWGRAYAVRDIVVSPIPKGVGLAIGFDGARAAFEGFRALTGRSAALRALDPVFDVVRRKVRGRGRRSRRRSRPRVRPPGRPPRAPEALTAAAAAPSVLDLERGAHPLDLKGVPGRERADDVDDERAER